MACDVASAWLKPGEGKPHGMGLGNHKARVVSPAVNGGPRSKSPVERGCCLAALIAFEGQYLWGRCRRCAAEMDTERPLTVGLRRRVLFPGGFHSPRKTLLRLLSDIAHSGAALSLLRENRFNHGRERQISRKLADFIEAKEIPIKTDYTSRGGAAKNTQFGSSRCPPRTFHGPPA
jgi:hypothetical protein